MENAAALGRQRPCVLLGCEPYDVAYDKVPRAIPNIAIGLHIRLSLQWALDTAETIVAITSCGCVLFLAGGSSHTQVIVIGTSAIGCTWLKLGRLVLA